MSAEGASSVRAGVPMRCDHPPCTFRPLGKRSFRSGLVLSASERSVEVVELAAGGKVRVRYTLPPERVRVKGDGK